MTPSPSTHSADLRTVDTGRATPSLSGNAGGWSEAHGGDPDAERFQSREAVVGRVEALLRANPSLVHELD